MATNNDKKTSKSDGVTPSDLNDLYEKLISSQGRQNIQSSAGSDFKPSVMNIPSVPTAPVQTRLAGTQYYDNSPNVFIAPGYGQLKDVSIKRSNQAVATNTSWEKAKANLINSMPQVSSPDFDEVKNEFLGSINEYEGKLNQGDWADQTSMVGSFVDELINKRGGKQMAAINATKEAKRQELEEMLADHNSEKGVDGIPAEDLAFNQTPEKWNPFIRDTEGKVIGGGYYSYPQPRKARNLPMELNDFLSPAKGNVTLGRTSTDADGKQIQNLLVNVPELAQFGIESNKEYPRELVAQAAMRYIESTGGADYLQYKGKVNEFNNPMSADALREQLTSLSAAKGADPYYKTLIDMPDDQLLAASKASGLGARFQAFNLRNSVLQGAADVNAFKEETIALHSNAIDTAIEIAKGTFPYKGGSGDGSGSGKMFDEDGNEISADVPYNFSVTDVGLYNSNDWNSSEGIANRSVEINNSIDTINKQLEVFKANPNSNYDSNPTVKGLLKQKEIFDTERKVISELQGKTFNELSTVSIADNKISLSSMVTMIQSQMKDGKKLLNIPTKDLANTLQTAIFAEIDSDPKTNAEAILKKAGIPMGYLVAENTNYNSSSSAFRSAVQPFVQSKSYVSGGGNGSSFAMGTGGGSVDVPPMFELNKYIGSVAKKYKAMKGETDRSGKHIYDAKIEQNMMVFNLTGETAKMPEAMKLKNSLVDVTKDVASHMGNYKVHNPIGGQERTLARFLLDETKVKDEKLNDVVEVKEVRLGTLQNKMSKGLVYVATIGLKNPSKTDNPDAYDAVEKVKKKLGVNGTLEIPIQLGKNSHKDEIIKNDMLNMVRAGDKTLNGIDPVTRQNIFATLAKIEGISTSIDSAYLYNLDGSSKNPKAAQRQMKMGDNEIRVTAVDNPFASTKEDKTFHLEIKKDGQYKYIGVNNGKIGYYTKDQLNKDTTIKTFENTEDIKSFFMEAKYRSEGVIGNFNKGGSKPSVYGTDRPADRSRKYSATLDLNGKSTTQTTFVPKEQLVDLRGKVKISSNAGLPYINKEVAEQAINLINSRGLTVTGGLRTIEHPVTNNDGSAHFNGNAIDLRLDNNSRKLYAEFKANPAAAKKWGVQFTHDGDHMHITFAPPANNTGNQKSFNRSRIMSAIAEGESSGKNIGYHYGDGSKLSAFGKYGLTKIWVTAGAKAMGMNEEQFLKSPDVIDRYMHTAYLDKAKSDVAPYFPKLKERLERYLPNFSEEDAIFIYHIGLGRVQQLARGEITLDFVPPPTDKNISIREYVNRKRNFLKKSNGR